MSKTILLADDSVTIRKVVELTFMEEDYELVSLGGGEEAVDQLDEVDPDLVIADIHMPGVTGYEVCREAKKRRSERPVLLLVGTFEPFDAAELEASGADRHLKKPFDSQELLQTVRDLLADGEAASARHVADIADSADIADIADTTGGPEVPATAFEPLLDEPETGAELGALEVPPEAVGDDMKEPEAPQGAGSEASSADGGAAAGASNGAGELSDDAVERIARRVAELLGPDAIREVAWEVVPDLAEVVIRERLRELESQVE